MNITGLWTRRQCCERLIQTALVSAIAGRGLNLDAKSKEGDLAILSAAAALELQAVAAYRAGAASGKLSAAVAPAATAFLQDHERHAAALNDTLRALGADPIEPPKSPNFGPLPDQEAILALALELEQGAADAYAALAANIENRNVLVAAAGILVDEVRHVTTLRSVLGLPVV